MFNYYSLITLIPISNLEKTTICAFIIITLSFLFTFLNPINKNRKSSRMYKNLLFGTEYKCNDFKGFESKYKNMWYHEFFRIENRKYCNKQLSMKKNIKN